MIFGDEDTVKSWLVEDLGVTAGALRRLDELCALLAEENLRQNLVSQASLQDVWVRHIADSAQLLRHVPRESRPAWLDLGTGAGFPGMVVAICRPDLEVTLVESRTRRVEWLTSACRTLGLRCRIWGQRLERMTTAPFGAISARAFAPLERLIELSARFSTPDTIWLLPKGRGGQMELQAMSPKIQGMFHVEQSVTDPEAVLLIGHGKPGAKR